MSGETGSAEESGAAAPYDVDSEAEGLIVQRAQTRMLGITTHPLSTDDSLRPTRSRSAHALGRIAALPVTAGRDALRARTSSLLPPRYEIREDALVAAMKWLRLSHDVTGRRGSSKGFSLLFGWYPAFPETTGYIIGTLLAYGQQAGDSACSAAASDMGEWELEVQSPDGGIMEGLLDGRPKPSEAFNTGMVLHGWLDLHESTDGGRFIIAAERAGRFLVDAQDGDGAWRGEHSYSGIPHTYNSRVAWALIRLARASGESLFEDAARRNLDWVLARQRDNGWFEACIFKPRTLPSTHAIAYTLRGLLESSVLLEDERYLRPVIATTEVLMRKAEVLGTLPATFDSSWQPAARYVCLTGLAQLGGVWLRLFQVTGDPRYLNAGLKAVDQAAAHQEALDWLPVRGALPGSFPIYGRYAPLQYPNWATKFLADALLAPRRLPAGSMRVVLLSRYPRVDTPGWKRRLVAELCEAGAEVVLSVHALEPARPRPSRASGLGPGAARQVSNASRARQPRRADGRDASFVGAAARSPGVPPQPVERPRHASAPEEPAP